MNRQYPTVNEEHFWPATEDRARIEEFLRISARYLGLDGVQGRPSPCEATPRTPPVWEMSLKRRRCLQCAGLTNRLGKYPEDVQEMTNSADPALSHRLELPQEAF